MSRSKEYQRLLNDKRWKTLRVAYLRQHPLCEACQAEGFVRSAVDVHHRKPVESARTLADMERLAYDWHNLQALCVPCHIRVHTQERAHTKEAHQQRERERLSRWIARHTKEEKPRGAIFSEGSPNSEIRQPNLEMSE